MADENKAVLKIAVTHRKRPGGTLEAYAKTISLSTDGGLIMMPTGSGTEIIDKQTGYYFVTAKTINAIGAAAGWTDSALT